MISPRTHPYCTGTAIGAPVDDPVAACALLERIRREAPNADIIVMLLGVDRRLAGIVVVDGTGGDPDALLTVVEVLATVDRDGAPCDLVVGSIRASARVLADDAFRWVSASAIADDAGSQLVEWFVLADGIAWSPRDIVGEPPRW